MIVIDRNSTVGAETSSRSSEVVHSGLYYPNDSKKTKFCIAGRKRLYELCDRANIPYRKVGKWIFATNYQDPRWPHMQERSADATNFEIRYLETLRDKCIQLGIPSRWVHKAEIESTEPELRAALALESPETGIIDSHALMDFHVRSLEASGGILALNSNLVSAEQLHRGFALNIDSLGELTAIESKIVVNCAGLNADRVARLFMGDACPYTLHHAIGHYYAYTGKPLVSRLTYPVPDKHLTSLGVHTVLDLAGRMRFGPDVHYLPRAEEYPDYHFDDSPQRKQAFYDTVKKYLPNLSIDRISPDYTGIRPKLARAGEPFRDFIVNKESAPEGLINLIGIESPGLTSSLAIAEFVAETLLGYEHQDWYI